MGVSLRHFLIVLIVIEYWLLNIDYGRNSSNIDEVVEVYIVGGHTLRTVDIVTFSHIYFEMGYA